MRILEVRDGFIKFETNQKVALSSFVQVDDSANSYIAQVIQVKNIGENSIAYARIVFLYNGAFNEYDKSLPSVDSKIKEFDFNLFNETFNSKDSIIAGHFINKNEKISLSKDVFNKNLLICLDNIENNKRIVSNLAKQFESSLVIDTLGIFETNKFIAGVDFKLPLNTDALEFMFEDCLNDATSDSKNLIKEIFQDLAEYSKTVPFVPFGALKTIVDEMVEKNHIFKLLVLKNKLAKFDKLGYFAGTVEEAENLNKILSAKNAVIDLSKLDPIFQNRYLEIILSTIKKQKSSMQIFVESSNTLSKKNLKTVVMGELSTTLISHSRFKYINEIKTMYNNFIIEPSFTTNQIFKTYAMFLNAMDSDTYLLVGEGTNFIPLISNVLELSVQEDTAKEEINEEIIIEESTMQEDVSEVDPEELLAENDDLEETFEEEIDISTEEHTVTIERKSEELIEKVSEEVLSEDLPSALNLFQEDEEIEEEEAAEEVEIETEVFNNEEEDDDDIIINNDLSENDLETSSLDEYIEPISDLSEIDSEINENDSIEQTPIDIEEISESDHTPIEEDKDVISETINEEELETIEVSEELSELAEINEETPVVAIENIEENTVIDEPQIEEINMREYSEDINSASEPNEITALNSEDDEFDTIIELDETDLTEADVIIDFEDNIEDSLDEEALDKEIIEDVDKVFTTIKEDSISDSDLDFIDELNGNIDDSIVEEITLSEGMEELTELNEVEDDEDTGFIEPLEESSNLVQETAEEREILEKRNTSTPIVPVYGADIPAEDLVLSDPIEQGDTVVHAKYGNGVVEKMIKYGTKTLYSINFDNIGRRLLDPTLTEIKKG